MQPSGLYEHTFLFINTPLNGIKDKGIYEIHTTYNLSYNGVLYVKIPKNEAPKTVSKMVYNSQNPTKKITSKSYNINTSNIDKLLSGFNLELRTLYFRLEDTIKNKFSSLIINYIKKGVVVKHKKRIMQIEFSNNKMLIMTSRDILIYDKENKFQIRKGYTNQNLSYFVDVHNDRELDYVLEILTNYIQDILEDKTSKMVRVLNEQIDKEILGLDSNIERKELIRATSYKTNRNFVSVEKRNYGLYIKLLPVKDKLHILFDSHNSELDPLKKAYRVKEFDDIKTIVPYIKESLQLVSRCALDVKNNLTYICEKH